MITGLSRDPGTGRGRGEGRRQTQNHSCCLADGRDTPRVTAVPCHGCAGLRRHVDRPAGTRNQRAVLQLRRGHGGAQCLRGCSKTQLVVLVLMVLYVLVLVLLLVLLLLLLVLVLLLVLLLLLVPT